jgi:hypothetical protein
VLAAPRRERNRAFPGKRASGKERTEVVGSGLAILPRGP